MSDGDRDALVLAAAAAAVLATALLLCHPSFIRPALFRTSLHIPPANPSPDTPRTDADKLKTVRTKERRRRGKDPLRDILKSGKKLKALSSPNLAPDRLSPTTTKTGPASDSQSPAPSSSRSVSSSRSRTRTPLQDAQPSDREEDQAAPVVSAVSDTDQLASSQSEPRHSPTMHPATSLSSESAPSSDSSPTPITTPANVPFDLGTDGPPSALKSPEISTTGPVHSLLRMPSMPDADTPTATTSINGFYGTRHVPTPKRTPTPSSLDTNAPPPSVAIQTQLASVRGALEAARQREAQMKAELERYAKELEFMRWESAGWRRRELELQNQVHYLAHQLQTVAASFSPLRASAPLASSPPPPLNGTASSNSSNSSASANASPTKKEYNLPPQSQIIPPSPQIVPSSGLFSPLSMMHSPLYYGYPPTGGNHYSHFSPQNHPHPHSFPLSPTQQTNLMSIFSPNGSAAPSSGGGNSAPSSAPDSSSSTGSLSPGARVDRGRRKVRGNMHLGGWIGLSTEEEACESSDDEGNQVNKALADAILKRPGCLRLGSRKPRSSPNGQPEKGSPSSESQAEFTFPSLSALGNVKWGKQHSATRDSESVPSAPAQFNVSQNLEELLETEAQWGAVADPQPGASDLPAG